MSQQDDQRVGEILDRRQVLIAAGRAGLGMMAWSLLAGRVAWGANDESAANVDLVATPVLTEGPFFVDEKLNRSNILGDSQRESVSNGLPLALSLTVYRLAEGKLTPMKDVCVDVWHTDAAGVYSDEANPMNGENTARQTWLRGYQLTDGNGKVAFQTIFPGWYGGRTTHLHFKVRQFSVEHKTTAEFTSQFFFDDAEANKIFANAPYKSPSQRHVTNERDGIYNERLSDGTIAGKRLTLALADNPQGKGLASSYGIVLTDQTMHGSGRNRGPGRGRGPGPDGRPPGPPPDFGPGGPFDGPPPPRG